MNNEISGIVPAIASPCNEKDVFLEDNFAELADHLYRQGVNGLYVCGGTGDGPNMRLDERKRAVEIAVECSQRYNGKVIVHVGAGNLRDAIELAEHAAQAGADAVSSVPPPRRSHAQLLSYYRTIVQAAGLPLLVYYIPGMTGNAMTVDQMLALLDIENVIGFKNSDWNLFFMHRILQARPGTVVFVGADEFLFPGLLY